MASELLKNRALIQKLKEPEIPKVNFGLDEVDVEFVLPEPKPQELLDIQEENRKGRLLDSLNKIGGGLMDESVDFIKREEFDRGGMAKLVEYVESLPDGTVVTGKMIDDYIQKNNLKVNAMNFFTRKAPLIKGKTFDTSYQGSRLSELEKANIEKYGKERYDKLNTTQQYRVRRGENVGALAPEKTQKVKFKKAYDDAKKFYESQGVKFDDKIKERVRKSIAANEGKFIPPGKGAKVFKASTMKTVRDVFVNNPDADGKEIAKAMFGDKKFNAASLIEKEEMIKDANRQVPKFVRLFSPGSKEIIKGFKDIKPDKLVDILESIEEKTNEFGFDGQNRRELQFAIADAERGLPERTTIKAREKLLTKGKDVDEVVGVSATFKNAPGYIEATQVIDKDINAKKGKQIDLDFNKAFTAALKGDYSKVKNYNKKAKAFQQKYKVDTPIIRIGENLDPKDFVAGFKDYSPGAQENIKQVAKEKGIVIETKAKPIKLSKEIKIPMQESGQKKLTAFQELIKRQGSGIDPEFALKAGFEEFVKPAGKFAGQIARGTGTAADLLISAGPGAKGLGLGFLLEADPIITGMTEGKDFGQTARDTFIGSAIDAIPGVNLGSLNEDLIKLADTEEERVAVQNLIDYQKDYARFTKDLGAFKSYLNLDQVSLEELGFTASDLVNMENQLAKRFEDIQTRAPEVYNPEAFSLVRELAKKEAEKRKANLEGIQGLIFGDRMIKDPDFIDNQIQQILAASTGVQGATDSYTDKYRFFDPPEPTLEQINEIYEMGGITGAAEGGRIGFADGPIDPKRRLFLKIMGGIASLPIFSKFLGKSEVAKPVVKLAGTTTKMPEWFPDFVNKMMFTTGGKKIDADVMEYTTPKLPGVKMLRNDKGQIIVEGKNAYGEPYEIIYRPPGYELVDETTGKAVKTPGEFKASDTQFRRTGPEMDDFDVDFETVEDVDDILGGNATKLEGFAKGTEKTKYTKGQKAIDEAEALGERADEYVPYKDMDPTDFYED
tara:strand:- start:56 stop:3073 length:3018 start_codon:yes stop_codon:yes gene_type:complete